MHPRRVLPAAVLVIWGMGAARVLFFPLVFLSMMIPMPQQLIVRMTGQFQILSTSLAALIMRTFASSVSRQGNIIDSIDLPGPLSVAEPCSGLKLLLALLMASVFLAYMVESSWRKKVVLVAMSLPLSILINSLRVTMIGAVGVYSGSADTMHKYHDGSGYATLVVCVAAVYGSAWLMKMRYFRDIDPGTPSLASTPVTKQGRVVLVVGMILLLLGAGTAGCFVSMYMRPRLASSDLRIPMTVADWHGKDLSIDPTTRELLELSALVSRLYSAPAPSEVQVHLFVQRTADSTQFHYPNSCLIGTGWRILSDEDATLRMRDRNGQPVQASVLTLEGDSGSGQMLHWYDAGDVTLRRRGDVIKHAIDLRRILRNPLLLPQIADEVNRREITWYRIAIVTPSGMYQIGGMDDMEAFASDLGLVIGYGTSDHTSSVGVEEADVHRR